MVKNDLSKYTHDEIKQVIIDNRGSVDVVCERLNLDHGPLKAYILVNDDLNKLIRKYRTVKVVEHKKVKKVIIESGGVRSQICLRLSCSSTALRKYVDKHPDLWNLLKPGYIRKK